MTQAELNRAVARATGDTVATVARHGFVPLTPVPYEREPQTLDWDDHEQDRSVALMPPLKRQRR